MSKPKSVKKRIICGIVILVLAAAAALICYRVWGIQSARISYSVNDSSTEDKATSIVSPEPYQKYIENEYIAGCQIVHDSASAGSLIDSLYTTSMDFDEFQSILQSNYDRGRELEEQYPFFVHDPNWDDLRPFLEEEYYEDHSMICLDLRVWGRPIYNVKMIYAVYLDDTAHIFISQNADGATADRTGYLYCISAPEEITSVVVHFSTWWFRKDTVRFEQT